MVGAASQAEDTASSISTGLASSGVFNVHRVILLLLLHVLLQIILFL